MNGVIALDSEESEFVEVDPTGRYGRYNEILGKGASKIVLIIYLFNFSFYVCSYRAFDEYDGIEVAWNQVKLYDFLQSPEDLERLYCEIHLLKTLKHSNIMKFYTSWVDTANRNINFVTEMFTSGTLRHHDPPVIHRDLKCDNIFINGNQGEVKIGDLGLAAILRKSHAARCVGTPEFMAPEVYEEEYNELVDIYSFGMCVLEMVTFEYPYSECTHPAQIYKKVISGKKPDALYKVKDPEVRRFVEKCLATVSDRLSAWELLNDPFLQIDDYGYDLRPLNYQREYDEIGPFLRQPLLGTAHHSTNSSLVNGRVRNIYFPFDIETDTALSVATEMVAELDITDQDVTKIAEMIDGEIASLVPEWKSGFGLEESPNLKNGSCCQNCASDDSITGYLSSHRPGSDQCVTDGAPVGSSLSDGAHYTDIWEHHEDHKVNSQIPLDHENGTFDRSTMDKDEGIAKNDEENVSNVQVYHTTNHLSLKDDYDNEIMQELRWLKAKYKMQLRELTDQQLEHFSEFAPIISEKSGTNRKVYDSESSYNSCSPVHLVTAKSFYSGALLPHSLHRATSLPVDATDF
ncbi:hypothetical protein DH2020_049041 [Rehmannia glutinosa]|uniref:non-specific serine/threonine protein kinase n=1 Tax=Rehmannia glutinosa TaxID=99300 RepID=A0ABR0U4I6_REHGL